MKVKDTIMKMYGSRHETNLAVVLALLVLPCTAALYGCSASADYGTLDRPDVVIIDGLSQFGELERPAVAFPHDKHTEALIEQNKDCETCHPRMENGRLSQRFARLVDESRDVIMDIYHERCVDCHNETAAAGMTSGPTICGDCHRRRPLYVSTRTPMGFDRSLHHRHVEEIGYECGECHHELDEATKELVYVKGQETTCRYCHETEATADVSSLSEAAHWACVQCHTDMPNAGPTDCHGCHDMERRLQIARVEHPKRLERNQPDFTLLRTVDADLAFSKLNTVPFSHVDHEDFHDTCRTCHHESMTPCSECHTLGGSDESQGVTLQRAMHDLNSEHSCVGCHETHKAEPSCSGCHSLMGKGRLSEHACTMCHSGPSPVETAAMTSSIDSVEPFRTNPDDARLSFAKDDIPEKVTIDILSEKYEAARFPHRKVVDKLLKHINDSKIAIFFHGHEDVVCQGCHHHSPAGKKPPLCENCHSEPFNEAELFKPGILGAYHRQCIGCHESMQIEPTDCTGCHEEKTTIVSSLAEDAVR